MITKNYLAQVIALGSDIEEEVTIAFNGIILTGFATICPYKIAIGEKYQVSLSLSDICQIHKVKKSNKEFQRIGSNYSYQLTGILSDGMIDCGFKIYDELFETEFSFLNNSNVSLVAERLDIEFLE